MLSGCSVKNVPERALTGNLKTCTSKQVVDFSQLVSEAGALARSPVEELSCSLFVVSARTSAFKEK
jgi:hypothetical protein